MSYTLKDCMEIEQLCMKIAEAVQGSDDPNIITAALMTTAARACLQSVETDEYIIDQFRKTLASNKQLIKKIQESKPQ